jgi:hypothetical protein
MDEYSVDRRKWSRQWSITVGLPQVGNLKNKS